MSAALLSLLSTVWIKGSSHTYVQSTKCFAICDLLWHSNSFHEFSPHFLDAARWRQLGFQTSFVPSGPALFPPPGSNQGESKGSDFSVSVTEHPVPTESDLYALPGWLLLGLQARRLCCSGLLYTVICVLRAATQPLQTPVSDPFHKPTKQHTTLSSSWGPLSWAWQAAPCVKADVPPALLHKGSGRSLGFRPERMLVSDFRVWIVVDSSLDSTTCEPCHLPHVNRCHCVLVSSSVKWGY